MRAVLDASAALKWFVREEESEEMRELLSRHLSGELELHSPEFLLVELANALRYASGIGPADVLRAVEAVRSLHLKLVDDFELLGEAVELAFEGEVTVYDSLYVSLARRLGGRLITYDGELLRKFPELAVKASDLLEGDSD